ncbi:hypothetical protein ACKWTF_014559 [Chironomus riparius]
MVPTFYYGPLPVIIFTGVLIMGVLFYKILMSRLARRSERHHANVDLPSYQEVSDANLPTYEEVTRCSRSTSCHIEKERY